MEIENRSAKGRLCWVVKIDLIDMTDGKLAFSRQISATGKWMTEGGDTPKDLLDQPVEEYVNTLFRRVEKPSALW